MERNRRTKHVKKWRTSIDDSIKTFLVVKKGRKEIIGVLMSLRYNI